MRLINYYVQNACYCKYLTNYEDLPMSLRLQELIIRIVEYLNIGSLKNYSIHLHLEYSF